MGIYQFKPSDAEDFARSIGGKHYQRGSELFFEKCPYCGGSTSDKRTFSINLRTGKYKCFRSSCGAHGNMITLARDFNFSLGQNADEFIATFKCANILTVTDSSVHVHSYTAAVTAEPTCTPSMPRPSA